MDSKHLEKFSKQLSKEKDIIYRLLEKMESGKKQNDNGFVPPSTHGQDDEAERMIDLEIGIQTRGNLKEVLAEIEHALGKIDSGKYGRCETCGQEINMQRLEFLPSVRYCIDCQRQQEKK